jgi:uncharacterized cupin superfamily protein
MHEARIEDTPEGKVPADDGWFILNLAEMAWAKVDGGGTWSSFESPENHSEVLGFGVHVLYPGDTPGMYHAESNQEGFLVLSGECIAIVEGEERRMGAWDYFHCPPDTAHITVGAGKEPCAIVMVGTRSPDQTIRYVPDAVAMRHGAAVRQETTEPSEAYADRPPIERTRSPWPLGQPERR